ncbi:hypothetical protein Tco_1500956 [Tanacetum coccineum]
MTSKAKQMELDNALVSPKNHRVIGKCNMRINPGIKPKEPTYQVALDALALTTCYPAFLITSEVPIIYMHQFWATVTKHKSSYQFKIDKKIFSMNVKVLKEILNMCPKVLGKELDEPPTKEEALSFIYELGHSREIRYITDVVVDHLHQPWSTFASIINKVSVEKSLVLTRYDSLEFKYFGELLKEILNICPKVPDKEFDEPPTEEEALSFICELGHSGEIRDDSVLGTMRFVSRHADTQVYGALLPQAMTNQALLDSVAYKLIMQ